MSFCEATSRTCATPAYMRSFEYAFVTTEYSLKYNSKETPDLLFLQFKDV